MVVRVDPALHAALTKIAERLFSETRSEYSCSAVTRGLIALGLVAVTDHRLLAPLFVSARVVSAQPMPSLTWRNQLAIPGHDGEPSRVDPTSSTVAGERPDGA
jgi:hypothetical protein